MRAHAATGFPDEVCGVLVGRFLAPLDAAGALAVDREVVAAHRTRNAHPRPRGEYLVDPEEQLRILLDAEARGLDVVGFYHSHPIGPARLSTTDAARATWPGASYFLVWLAPEPGFGSWRWDEARGRFAAERVDVV